MVRYYVVDKTKLLLKIKGLHLKDCHKWYLPILGMTERKRKRSKRMYSAISSRLDLPHTMVTLCAGISLFSSDKLALSAIEESSWSFILFMHCLVWATDGIHILFVWDIWNFKEFTDSKLIIKKIILVIIYPLLEHKLEKFDCIILFLTHEIPRNYICLFLQTYKKKSKFWV